MTIHRVGEAVEPHIRDLGKLLVTTDDLDALWAVLRKQIYHPDALEHKPNRFNVEFDGGYFDELSDFPRLTDDEARTLRLRGRDVVVVLGPNRATAIGEKEAAEDIYRLWARSRQTDERLPRRKRQRPWWPIAVAAGFLLYALLPIPEPPLPNISDVWLRIGVTILFIFPWLTSAYFSRSSSPESASYAVIKPYSLEEHRRNQMSMKYPRRQSIITAVAVCVTAVSMTVAVLTFLTK